MSELIIVMTTCPSLEEAKKISRLLIEKKVSACVNILTNVTSMYFWENEIKEDSEYLLIIKSIESKYNTIKEIVEINHSYRTVEVIKISELQATSKYSDWLKSYLK